MSRKLADLGNQIDTNRVLRSYVGHMCPPEMYAAIKPGIQALGQKTGGVTVRRSVAFYLSSCLAYGYFRLRATYEYLSN